MKNSTLIFRSIALISGVLFAWFNPIATLLILLIALALAIFAYLIFSLLELGMHEKDYGNEKYDYTIVPKKYNFISIFIDWINSFPSIIKKKDLEN
jgi:hypothetical protein